jgi:hypothetical protein
MNHGGSLTGSSIILNHRYQTHATEPLRGLYGFIAEGVLGIQVRHVWIGTCIKLRSSYTLMISLK